MLSGAEVLVSKVRVRIKYQSVYVLTWASMQGLQMEV